MEGVFSNIHVLDFSWVAVGPIHTKCLADFGAAVVRVESATRPDVLDIQLLTRMVNLV